MREVAATHVNLVRYYLFLHRLRKKVERDTAAYVDRALTMPEPGADDAFAAAPAKRIAAVAA